MQDWAVLNQGGVSEEFSHILGVIVADTCAHISSIVKGTAGIHAEAKSSKTMR